MHDLIYILAYQIFLPRNSNSRLLQTFLFPRPSLEADRGHDGFGRSCAPAAQQERTIKKTIQKVFSYGFPMVFPC